MTNAVHAPVTIGTANGLSISGQVLSLALASAGTTGALSSGDWTTFNSKVSPGRLINTTAPLAGGGDLSADRTLSISQSGVGADGYLSSTDWNTFNNKVPTSRTISTTAPLTGGGDLSANRTFAITQASGSTDGYLSSANWNTFNNKVDGPASADDNRIARFDSTTGKLIQNSLVSISDVGAISGATSLALSNTNGGIITPTTLTATRNYTLPNKSGTFAMTSDLQAWSLQDAFSNNVEDPAIVAGDTTSSNFDIGIDGDWYFRVMDSSLSTSYISVYAQGNEVILGNSSCLMGFYGATAVAQSVDWVGVYASGPVIEYDNGSPDLVVLGDMVLALAARLSELGLIQGNFF